MQFVSGRLFEILGVDAAVGRTFTPEEDRPGNDVALISHRLWSRRFGGDAGLVGRRVQIGGLPRTMVGVMPAGFSVLDPTVDLWMPMGFDERARTHRGRYLIAIGRLGSGVSLAHAQSEMTQIAADLTAAKSRVQHRLERQSRADPRPGHRQDPTRVAAAAWRGGSGPAHRLRERRQPAAGARRLAAAGDCRAHRAGGLAQAHRRNAARRKRR